MKSNEQLGFFFGVHDRRKGHYVAFEYIEQIGQYGHARALKQSCWDAVTARHNKPGLIVSCLQFGRASFVRPAVQSVVAGYPGLPVSGWPLPVGDAVGEGRIRQMNLLD